MLKSVHAEFGRGQWLKAPEGDVAHAVAKKLTRFLRRDAKKGETQ